MFDIILPNNEIYTESKTYSPGSKAVVAQIKLKRLVNLGMSICYDLRFPNLYQDLAKNDAKIIAIPLAFSTNTGKLHWHALLKARAIETGTFIIAPAQVAIHINNRETYGYSLIISPFGKILADSKKEETVINVTINLDVVIEAKKIIQNLNF